MRRGPGWWAVVALVVATALAAPAAADSGTRTAIADPCGVEGLTEVDPSFLSAEPVVVAALDLCRAWVATSEVREDGPAVLEVGFDLAGEPARPVSGQVHTYRMTWSHAGCAVTLDVERPGNAAAADRVAVERTCEPPECLPGGELRLLCQGPARRSAVLEGARLEVAGSRLTVTFPAAAEHVGRDYTAGTVLSGLRALTLHGTYGTGNLGVTVGADVTRTGGDHVVGR